MPKFKIPGTFTIVFAVIVICAVLTWIIPGGEYVRHIENVAGSERSIADPASYHQVAPRAQTWQVFTAFFNGFSRTSGIIVFILMIGGSFGVIGSMHAIDRGIKSFLGGIRRMQRRKFFSKFSPDYFVIGAIMLMFSLFGAVFGMSEETIAFVPVFVPLAISMGYDSITGLLMCYLAAHIGFAGALFNPFTLGIAQGLSGLQPFSGLEYRFLCWCVITLLGLVFVFRYAARVKRTPQLSFMYAADAKLRNATLARSGDTPTATATAAVADTSDAVAPQEESFASLRPARIVFGVVCAVLLFCSIKFPLSEISLGGVKYSFPLLPLITFVFGLSGIVALRRSVEHFVCALFMTTILLLIAGVLGYDWYIGEIAGLFFAMGLLAGLAGGFGFDKTFRLFLGGCGEMLNAALIVGLAGGIIVILEDGKIIDTIIYYLSLALTGSGRTGSLAVMYAFQTGLNLIIPSGSAKAALTIPMMSQFSDIVGLSRQTTVLAFQFADGFTNMITPASGVLIGVLGVAGVPYSKWLKFILPFVLILIATGFLLLLPTILFPINGF